MLWPQVHEGIACDDQRLKVEKRRAGWIGWLPRELTRDTRYLFLRRPPDVLQGTNRRPQSSHVAEAIEVSVFVRSVRKVIHERLKRCGGKHDGGDRRPHIALKIIRPFGNPRTS